MVTGKRPGEKMYEELFNDATLAYRIKHAKIMRGAFRDAPFDFSCALPELISAVATLNEQRARAILIDIMNGSS